MDDKWIVDAMNVIGSRPDRWWIDPDEAMRALAQVVDAHAACGVKKLDRERKPDRLRSDPSALVPSGVRI